MRQVNQTEQAHVQHSCVNENNTRIQSEKAAGNTKKTNRQSRKRKQNVMLFVSVYQSFIAFDLFFKVVEMIVANEPWN